MAGNNRSILAAQSAEEIARVAVRRLRELIPTERVTVVLAGPEPGQSTVLAAYVESGRILEAGKRLPTESYGDLANLITEKLQLIGKEKLLGTLNLGSETPCRYREEDAIFLQEVAGQVALAIENMLAYEEIAALKARLEQENIYLQEEIRTEHNFQEIIGQSAAIRKVLQAIETVAPTGASVLILGETGTGKELIARAVHNLSPQKDKPLVKVNCAALASTLIESELFGHEKGAFTGALTRKIGRFELANDGTIFLDEITFRVFVACISCKQSTLRNYAQRNFITNKNRSVGIAGVVSHSRSGAASIGCGI